MYGGWLDRQRAALQAALEGVAAATASPTATAQQAAALGAASRLLSEGPPDGAFSHRAAVDAWMQLLHKVITKGNFFLLQASCALLAAQPSLPALCR